MAGPLRTYGYINARLRARISLLLPDPFFDDLAGSSTLVEAVNKLSETRYAPLNRIYHETGDLKLVEKGIYREETRLLLEIERIMKGREQVFTGLLAERYELRNIKSAVRLWFDRCVRGRDVTEDLGYIEREPVHFKIDWDGVVNAADLEGIASILQGTPYAAVVRENAEKVRSKGNLFPLELALDHAYFERLLAAAGELSSRDRAIAGRIIGVETDLENLRMVLHFVSGPEKEWDKIGLFLLPGGEFWSAADLKSIFSSENPVMSSGELLTRRFPFLAAMLEEKSGPAAARFAILEQMLAFIMQREIRRILAGYPFTIGIVLAYMLLKKKEMERILSILHKIFYTIGTVRLRKDGE